jgi:glycosyltransferase involved in cell wall biosynthesis
LTELVKAYDEDGHTQAVIAGVTVDEGVDLPEGVSFYPVEFETEKLPFSVVGMSDVMPYANTRYCDLTVDMTTRFCEAFLTQIAKAFREFQPDLVICHHLYLVTALATELRELLPEKARMVAICHSTCLRQYGKNKLEKERIYRGIRNLDRIYALHQGQREEISRVFDVPETEIEIVGAGFNEKIFYPRHHSDSLTYEVCFAGKVSQAKGVKSLLKTLERIQPKRPVVMHLAGGNGDDMEMEEIRAYAEELSQKGRIRVVLEGKLPQEELAKLYQKCDLFVLPSFYEGLPLVLLEAMACGCLAVAADWPGVRDWIMEKVPEASLLSISLPNMKMPGVPEEGELSAYEERLKQAIEQQLGQIEKGAKQADVSALTWRNVAGGIIVKEYEV